VGVAERIVEHGTDSLINTLHLFLGLSLLFDAAKCGDLSSMALLALYGPEMNYELSCRQPSAKFLADDDGY
jgi:hypothetical protein